jgi:2-dehydro-3-deoxyphosphooctonate aldolase (KDO 8-P synthase)
MADSDKNGNGNPGGKRTIRVADLTLGEPERLFLIAGPCVIESEERCRRIARLLSEAIGATGVPFLFKASYDKANRSSAASFRGPGLERGIEILAGVKAEFGFPILTDVHCRTEVPRAAEVADILQIPAFLSRQTDLIQSAARTGRAINVKKGQFLSPWDTKNVIGKIEAAGGREILLTERGTSFGYNNLVVDMRSIPIMQQFGYPVVFDATHSLQLPGGRGTSTGGLREYIPHLARAAVAAGCDGVFFEVHDEPEKALCDRENVLTVDELARLLTQLLAIRASTTGP